MSKRLRLCDSSAHNKCSICVLNSLEIPPYSYGALKSLHATSDPTQTSLISLERTFEQASVTLKDLIHANKCILNRMEEAQMAVDATVRNISLVLRPIPHLPDDVLYEIFLWCIPSEAQKQDYHAMSYVTDSLCTTLSPWSLSYVCRQWRAVAVSTPALWSTISIPLDLYGHTLHRRGSSRLALYLQRSGTTKLNITLQYYGHVQVEKSDMSVEDSDILDHPVEDSFMRLLRPTTSRWSQLEFIGEEYYFETLSTCPFPSLRQFTFFYRGSEPTIPFAQHCDIPGLTNLTMRSWGTVELPWANIRTLTSCASMLHKLPTMLNLEMLNVDNTHCAEWYHYVPCVLPKLHTISFLSSIDMDDLLSYLVAPALHTLELRIHDAKSRNGELLPTHELGQFTNLSVEVIPRNDDMIISLLSRTTSVTTLSIGPNTASSEVLNAIRCRVLPKLASIRVDFETVREQPGEIVSMIESRRASTNVMAALEEVTFVRSGRDVGHFVDGQRGFEMHSIRWNGDMLWERWMVLQEDLAVRYLDGQIF